MCAAVLSEVERRRERSAPERRGIGWLAIAGRSVRLSDVVATATSRARWLAPHRGRSGAVACLCAPDPIPLGVKYYAPYGTYALYALRRQDPARHAPGCPLGFEPGSRADGGIALGAAPCVVEAARGYELTPGWPLWEGPPSGRNTEPRPAPLPAAPSVRRPAAGRAAPLTLLELLWRVAGLHYWQPAFAGEREYEMVARRIGAAAARVTLRGRPLRDWLYVPPPYHPSRAPALAAERRAWLDRLAPTAKGAVPYGYVIGVWRGVGVQDGAARLFLRHCPLPLIMPEDRWRTERARWNLGAEAQAGPPPWPVAWLAIVRREREDLAIRDLAALALADERTWLPCASEYERRLIRQLATAGRRFVKPLAAGGLGLDETGLLPDLVLLDRRDRCALEVLGRLDDPAYAKAWEEKARRYRASGRAYWAWDPRREPDPPPVPPPD
jgi:hypothetical protein